MSGIEHEMADWNNFEARLDQPKAGFHSVEKTYSDMCANISIESERSHWETVSSLIKFLEANQ